MRSERDEEAVSMDATYRAIGCFITHFSNIEEVMRDYLALKVGLALQDYNAVITHDFALLCTAKFSAELWMYISRSISEG